jgi:hypothetical protein
MVEDAVLCATAKVVVKLAWRASPAATMVVGRKWGSVFLCVHLVLSSSSMVLWGSWLDRGRSFRSPLGTVGGNALAVAA